MINKVNVNNNGIDSSGLPKDYKIAIAEFIWNGFDADATTVDISFESNEIDSIESLKISDNGKGIVFETLNESFGAFLDSMKRKSFQRSSYTRGKKGKGRFSFATFAEKATWHTVYEKDGKFLEYDIQISKEKKDDFEDKNSQISKSSVSGTSVTFENLFEVTAYSFSNNDFKDFLAKEFGWFLFLNKGSGFSLTINNIPIEYDYLISDSGIQNISISSIDGKNSKCTVSYIRWSSSIGDKYYYYFLNEGKRETAKKLTSYNNNAIDFHHSVFVESSYFDDFILQEEDSDVRMFGKNQNDPGFKSLMKDLDEFLSRKQRDFIRETAATDLVIKLEKKGVFPKFANNRYDTERKQDLISVVKELYCVQPKIFKNLKKEQEITFLGFLNLLLDTDERENILEIIEGIVQLNKDERVELVNVLRQSSFSRILSTIKLIENRFKAVELLRTLVFDLKKFSTERNHIQTAIEENYWLFGEQFHLASADKNFEYLLSSYLHIIDGVTDPVKLKAFDWKRRPDIFVCRKRDVPDSLDVDSQLEENIMVELKRPTVTITKKEFRQIDDYLDFILKEDQFNSQTRIWKFYVISNKVDDYIHKQYEAFKDKSKRYLVQQAGRYEIYALTWDDLFRTFEIKHKYLLDKLEYDKTAIHEHLNLKGISLDLASSDSVTASLAGISKN